MFERAIRVGRNGGMHIPMQRTTTHIQPNLFPTMSKGVRLAQIRGQTKVNFSTQMRMKPKIGGDTPVAGATPLVRSTMSLLSPRLGLVMNQSSKQTRSSLLRLRRRNCSTKSEQKPEGEKEAHTGSAEKEAGPREMSHITWAEFREAPFKSLRNWWYDNSDLFRQYIRNYGGLTLTFYISMYVGVLAIIWALVELGAVKGPDVNKWLRNSRIKHWISPNKELQVSPHITNFLTAWLLTKTTEPFRILITLFIEMNI